jgi:thiamine-monophosphate kinase
MTGQRRGEFELIAKFFAPLARNASGAFGLLDDAALMKPRPGYDIVVTADAIVAGVHFLPDDPPETIARKALRVNLSDLAAKGAEPRAYVLTIALPADADDAWLESFAAGLKQDQKRFGIELVGGDTVATPGPLTMSITAFGDVPRGKMMRRAGAKVGDDVWVSGTIGDAALGLRALQRDDLSVSAKQRDAAVARYRIPEPRVAVGKAIRDVARACLDVSDGLVADLGHVATVSRVGIRLDASAVPLSSAAAAAVAAGTVSLSDLLTGGDDYELAFAAPPAARKRLAALAAKTKVRLTKIGEVGAGRGVVVQDRDGAVLSMPRTGFTHF